MDRDRKNWIILGILIVVGSVFSLIIYLHYPFCPIDYRCYNDSIIASIVCIVIGLVFLGLSLIPKLPFAKAPLAGSISCLGFGSLHLVLFILSPNLYSILFITIIVFYEIGGFFLWVHLVQKRAKSVGAS